MAIPFDPQVAAFLAQYPEEDWSSPDDPIALRAAIDPAIQASDDAMPESPGIERTDHWISGADGGRFLVRWYSPPDRSPGPAVVFAHGGGMIAGSLAAYDRTVAYYVHCTGVPFLSVDYRLAPESTGTTCVEDGFSALRWLVEASDELGLDPDRIAVMGDSAGGGVAAGVAIAARDRGVRLAAQLLVYPMLDDRNVLDRPNLAGVLSWTAENNRVAWTALLGAGRGGVDVSPLAAPARLTDFRGLAPAYIEVTDLDIFREESLRYALCLLQAEVSTELHLWSGAPHGFDRYVSGEGLIDVDVTRRTWSDRCRRIRSL